MGIYINVQPPKVIESGYVDNAVFWLREQADAEPPGVIPAWPPREGEVYVCVMANPQYTAAGIAVDRGEYDRFSQRVPGDEREKRWWIIPLESLRGILRDWEFERVAARSYE